MSMNYQRSYSYYSNRSFTQRFIAGLVLFIVIGLFFYLSWQLYKLLYLLSPLFIALALIFHSPVVGNHIKSIGSRFQNSVIGGMLNVLVQIIGLPIVTIGLAFKAWAYKKFGHLQRQMNAQTTEESYTPFEEVQLNETPLDLNQEQKRPEKDESPKDSNQQNHYDDLFV